VALANLELFRRDRILEQMQAKIAYARQRLLTEMLSRLHVSDIRQWGFMIGIELVENKKDRRNYPTEKRVGHRVIQEARKRAVMIRPLGDVIILMPPLTISQEELTTLLDVVHECIQVVTEG
jgi:adenosylmethionine---8-amino-7-oxononanoate aminotransferase